MTSIYRFLLQQLKIKQVFSSLTLFPSNTQGMLSPFGSSTLASNSCFHSRALSILFWFVTSNITTQPEAPLKYVRAIAWNLSWPVQRERERERERERSHSSVNQTTCMYSPAISHSYRGKKKQNKIILIKHSLLLTDKIDYIHLSKTQICLNLIIQQIKCL